MSHATPGGCCIFSTSNCLFKGMPLENYRIMLDEYEKTAGLQKIEFVEV
jgi:hypothetical protein